MVSIASMLRVLACGRPPRRRGAPAPLAWVVLALLQGAGWAQTSTELQQIERTQQQEQARQQRQLEQDRQRARPPVNLSPAARKRAERRPAASCRDIREVRLNGANLLLLQTQHNLTQPYAGRCLNVNDIEQLMEDVTAHYVEAGYIAARVYLGKQDLSSGVLELTVIEGVLEGLRIDDDGRHSISAPNVLPGRVGAPLNLRDVEQGLDQINRLASNNATMSIEPGQQPGGSVLVMSNAPVKPWRVNLSLDNFGSASTGRNQLAASYSLDNPLGFNDFVSVSDRRTIDRDGGRRSSIANSLSYTVPFGWTTWAAGYSRSSYVSTLVTGGGDLRSSGDSEVAYLRADQLVYRDRRHWVSASATLTRKANNTYVGGNFLEIGSRVLAVVDYDLSWRTQAGGGVLFLGLGLSEGTKRMGALEDLAGQDPSAPRAQFQKTRLSASWSKQFTYADRAWDLSAQFNRQNTSHVLFGSEQFLIGGPQSVRGFRSTSLSSDGGWMLRNEVGVRTPLEMHGHGGWWRAYVGVDAGAVHGRASSEHDGNLAGAAVGVQLRIGAVLVDAFAMTPLNYPSGFATDGTTVHGTVSISF